MIVSHLLLPSILIPATFEAFCLLRLRCRHESKIPGTRGHPYRNNAASRSNRLSRELIQEQIGDQLRPQSSIRM